MTNTTRFSTFLLALWVCSCGSTETTGDGATGDGGSDAPIDVDCRAVARGTVCGVGRVCIDLMCAASTCGDGIVYGDEACDDQNQVTGDGCESNCQPSCTADSACADATFCNGDEVCGAADSSGRRRCGPGPNRADGARCAEAGETGRCAAGVCGSCGDSVVDDGETCDDGNDTEADGCDNDCTYSCTADSECLNTDACDGLEFCNQQTHACEAGSPPDCNDNNECTADSCVAADGCVYDDSTTDADGDGYYSAITCATVGTDCDDTRADRYPGAPEACTDAVDLNCDGTPGTAATPTWYIDCDRDGYAANATGSVTQCSAPPSPQVCGSGDWITRNPVGADNIDCQDVSPQNESVNPSITAYFETPYTRTGGSTSYDYNCSGALERQYTQSFYSAASGHTAPCLGNGRFCSGSSWWVSPSLPACGATAIRSYCSPLSCTRTTASTLVRCH